MFRWLYFNGQKEEAREILKELRGTDDVDEEIKAIDEDFRRTRDDAELGGEGLV